MQEVLLGIVSLNLVKGRIKFQSYSSIKVHLIAIKRENSNSRTLCTPLTNRILLKEESFMSSAECLLHHQACQRAVDTHV